MQKPLASPQLQDAISRWDSEGGAGPDGPQESSNVKSLAAEVAPNIDVEIVQLRIRIIALENLMIAVLAEGTDFQRNKARNMAALIVPRMGATPHPLTIRAAARMVDLIERVQHLRSAVEA